MFFFCSSRGRQTCSFWVWRSVVCSSDLSAGGHVGQAIDFLEDSTREGRRAMTPTRIGPGRKRLRHTQIRAAGGMVSSGVRHRRVLAVPNRPAGNQPATRPYCKPTAGGNLPLIVLFPAALSVAAIT